VAFWISREEKASVSQDEVVVRRRHHDATRGVGHLLAITGIRDAVAGLGIQPVGERFSEQHVDVKNYECREQETDRQAAQNLQERPSSTCRRPDGNDLVSAAPYGHSFRD
jgi:hypothetical protein